MITPLLLTLLFAQEGGWSPPPPPPLVPSPVQFEPRFSPFVLPDEARIVATEEGLGAQVRLLQSVLENRTGRRIPLGEPPAKGGDFVLSLGYLADSVAGRPEAYAIEVFGDHVGLYGEDAVGVARAIARLPQLLSYDQETDSWSLPAVRIDDAPANEWRGLMLDLARFPHPVDSVREAIDLAFFFSLNVVHLHLSDDQAFTFPTQLLPPRTDPGRGGAERGYQPEDIAFLVEYAQARGIELVPEIDMPAHSSALVRARPDLFGRVDPETGEAVSTGAVNMTSAAAREAMKSLVDEVLEAFSHSRYFHLGGDEVWAPGLLKLPAYAALRDAEGLPAADDGGAMNALLNWFLTDMAAHVTEAGRQPIVWEGFRPVPNGKAVPSDVWVMAWNQRSQTPEALLAAGHPVINCCWEPLYVVPAQSWASQPVDAFDWSPRSLRQRFAGRVANVDDDADLRGVQICVWEQRPEAILPALQRVIPEIAERAWGSHATPDSFEAFDAIAASSTAAITA
ncbi:MAG: family 20 glycosylhydrolase, partial [Planctomycetota bacterium]